MEAFDETIQVIEATPEIPPAPAHSTQPCLATSLEAAEVTTTVQAGGAFEPPKAWTPSPPKPPAPPPAKNYTDQAAGMTVHDRLAALEFSDYGSDSDLGDLAAADQILGALAAEEAPVAAAPEAEGVTLVRENSWDAPSPT